MSKTAEYTIRTLFIIIANAIIAVGIALYYGSSLGSDPVSLWVDGLHVLLKVDYGMASLITNSTIIVLLFFIYRKYLHIGTVIITASMSFFINLFVSILDSLIPVSARNLPVQIAFLAVGALVLAVGIGLQISVHFGTSASDALFLSLSDWVKKPYKLTRIFGDATFSLFGWLMGGIIGVGTIVGVLVTGPIASATIKFSRKVILPALRLKSEE